MPNCRTSRIDQGSRGLGRGLAGFTLIEVMVTVAVLAILAAVALPAMAGLINNNRLASQANDLVADIHLARSEAVRRNRIITLCRTTDGSTCAAANGRWNQWLVFDAGETAAADRVLQSRSASARIQVSAPSASVGFRSDGLARTTAGALFSGNIGVCVPADQPAQNMRNINIAAGGSRISTQRAAHTTPGACP